MDVDREAHREKFLPEAAESYDLGTNSHALTSRRAFPAGVRCARWAACANFDAWSKFPASRACRADSRNRQAFKASNIKGARSAPQREQRLVSRKRAWQTGHRIASV
jgi:hypothetical protein